MLTMCLRFSKNRLEANYGVLSSDSNMSFLFHKNSGEKALLFVYRRMGTRME